MLNLSKFISIRTTFSLVMAAALVTGCGSSSSGAGTETSSISGSVFASQVNGASCEIQSGNGTTIAGPFMTDTSGGYTVDIPTSDLTNDLLLICTGGTYTDEADGSTQTAGTLSAYMAGGSLTQGDSIHATPGSSIVQQLISTHNMSMTEAQNAFSSAFGFTPDTSVAPTDATAPANNASDPELLAGLRAATFSQLTADLGLATEKQFMLLNALAKDLSDGTLDGEDGTGEVVIEGTDMMPADIQNKFALAMLNFRDGGNDSTGLTNNAIGSLPFGKTFLTENFKVEYVPGMMDAMQGKNQFKIRLKDRATNMVVSGENVSLMPMMHMQMHSHSTPYEACTEDNDTAGTYNCSLYYLMASQMMDGTSMGYWDIKVIIGGMMMNGMMMNGEEAHFYPPVMMAMGDTALERLKSNNDQIPDMMGMMAARNYFLFKSDLSGMTDNHSFQLFVAAQESMMKYPAVYPNVTLGHMGMDENSDPIMIQDLTVSSMTVKMSTTPNDANSWVTADGSSNDGYWTASGITGLTNGTEGTIYVQMEINGEQYSTNGEVADSDNGYAMFTVTPGSSMGMM